LKLVRNERVSNSAISRDVNVSTLTPGIYFIRINSNKSEMLRFVKIK
jgi:hypothetical protein